MRCILVLFAWLLAALPSALHADIVFTITPDVAGSIELGNSVTFSINMRTDTGTVTNLGGIDFIITANDPGKTGSVITGGQFVSGTAPFFPTGSGSYKLPFPTSTQIFGANTSTPQTVTTSTVTLATVTLSTLGATPGNYTLGFELKPVLAVDTSFIAAQAPTSIPYTIITAVPEPSSALFAIGGAAVGGVRLLRRRQLRHRTADCQNT